MTQATSQIAAQLTFGVEIETTMPAGYNVGSYHGSTQAQGLPAGWKATRDGSIVAGPGRVACEFVSPVLRGEEGLRQVVEVVAKIREMGGEVNRSCGVHVHVGWSGNETETARLVTLVSNFEKAIYATTGTKARENGSWCGSVRRHENAAAAIEQAGSYRYHVLNLTNYRTGRVPAVEFRAFAATLNAMKIVGHVMMCLGLVERAMVARRSTNWVAKTPAESSPIKRGGEGLTEVNRLFYQLGWTKGRTDHGYGVLAGEGIPSLKDVKAKLVEMAKKYDAR